jgi:hypothetical protein
VRSPPETSPHIDCFLSLSRLDFSPPSRVIRQHAAPRGGGCLSRFVSREMSFGQSDGDGRAPQPVPPSNRFSRHAPSPSELLVRARPHDDMRTLTNRGRAGLRDCGHVGMRARGARFSRFARVAGNGRKPRSPTSSSGQGKFARRATAKPQTAKPQRRARAAKFARGVNASFSAVYGASARVRPFDANRFRESAARARALIRRADSETT